MISHIYNYVKRFFDFFIFFRGKCLIFFFFMKIYAKGLYEVFCFNLVGTGMRFVGFKFQRSKECLCDGVCDFGTRQSHQNEPRARPWNPFARWILKRSIGKVEVSENETAKGQTAPLRLCSYFVLCPYYLAKRHCDAISMTFADFG